MISSSLAFRPTPYADYCRETIALAPNVLLGNASAWTPDVNQPNDPLPSVPSQKWSLPHGARADISVEPLAGKTVPLMKRVRYREAQTASKPTCALEMRIYKKDPAATGLPPAYLPQPEPLDPNPQPEEAP